MTDLNQQTEALTKALQTLHSDLGQIHLTLMIVGVVVVALLLVVAFRCGGRRP